MVPSTQQSAIGAAWQRFVVTSQVSAVQTSPSLQSVSTLQQPSIGVCSQTSDAQLSAVHALWSSQSLAARQQPGIAR